jgi:putative oxidoreductase
MLAMNLMERKARAAVRKDVALLPPRAALATAMLYHGIDKLKPAVHEQTGQFFESVGIRPGHRWARATAVTETAAGALAMLGVLTRPAALAVLVTQAVAVAKVHGPKGYAVTRGGFEYNLALMAVAGSILIAGPGRFSLHEALERTLEKTCGRNGLLTRLVRLVK